MPKVDDPAARLYGPLAPGFGPRVAKAVATFKSKLEAADAMGISKDQVNKIIGEKAVPNFAAIAALSMEARVPLEWLAFARGPDPFGDLSTRISFSDAEARDATTSDVIYLRGYDLQTAGTMNGVAFSRQGFERLRLSVDDVAVLEQPGDNMEPTIRRGALVMVNLRRRDISDGAIVACRVGGERMIKRIQREPDGSVQLLSDNRNYGAIKVLPEAVGLLDVLGAVVWFDTVL